MTDQLEKQEMIQMIEANCPNYDSMINFIIPRGDIISNEIKDKYVDFVTGNIMKKFEIDKVKKLDIIIGEYISNDEFLKQIQLKYNQPLYDDDGCEFIFEFYDFMNFLYEKYIDSLPSAQSGRWI